MRRPLLILLVLLAGLLQPPDSRPERISGELELKEGVVKVRRWGVEMIRKTPGFRMKIYSGDVIHTGPATRAHLSFRADNELVELFPNAVLHVETFALYHTWLGLTAGKIIVTREITLPRDYKFRLRTPAVNIGGHDMELVVVTTNTKSYLLNLAGSALVSSRDPPGAEVPVIELRYYAVEKGQPSAAPVKVAGMEDALLGKVVKGDGLEGFLELEAELAD